MSIEEDADDTLSAEIANEFAMVRVRVVETVNGRRLEITSPRQGTAIQLCPLELESLTWQSAETFSRLLSTPFGEQDDE